MRRLTHLLPLFEQGIVSLTNFGLMVFLARELALDVFGLFSICFVLVILASYIHGAIVSVPMMTFLPAFDKTESRQLYLNKLSGLNVVATLLLLLLLSFVSILILSFTGFSFTFCLSLTLAIALVPYGEWCRRFFYADKRPVKAAVYSFLRTVFMVALLAIFFLGGELKLEHGLYALAASSFVPAIVLLLCGWFPSIAIRGCKGVFLKHWKHGKHMLPVGLLEWFNLQGFLLFCGTHAAGGIRAAQNLVGPLNIVYQSLDNILPTNAGSALSQQGAKGVWVYIFRSSAILLAMLGPLCILLAVFAQEGLTLVYGESFSSLYPLVMLQLISLLLGVSHKLLGATFRVFESTVSIYRSYLSGFVVFILLLVLGNAEPFSIMVSKVIAEVVILLLMVNYGAKIHSIQKNTVEA